MAWKFFTPISVSSLYGTSLPASPSDGQQFVLVDSITTPTYQWQFRYNAGSSNADKWEFIGGLPVFSYVDTQESRSGAFGALATAGPSITVSRAGCYIVQVGSWMQTTGGVAIIGQHSYDVGGTGASTNDCAQHEGFDSSEDGSYVSPPRLKTGIAASTAFVSKYSGTSTVQWARRWMSITPVRVS